MQPWHKVFINLFYAFELKQRKVVTETVVQTRTTDRAAPNQMTITLNKLPGVVGVASFGEIWQVSTEKSTKNSTSSMAK